MNNNIKYVIISFSAIAIIGIIVAFSLTKEKNPLEEYRKKFLQVMVEENEDLPMNIGTVGTLDSITFRDNTMFYNITVFGSDSIQKIYREHYTEHLDMVKYLFLEMNGQSNNGYKLFEIIKTLKINFGIVVYSSDRCFTELKVMPDELEQFIDSCKVNPTEALSRVIDMNIEMANLSLPGATMDDAMFRTVSINTMLAESEDGLLLMSVSHVGDSIVLKYNVDETKLPIDNLVGIDLSNESLNSIAEDMAADPDALDFIRMIVISHSTLTLKLVGSKSKKEATISIPYSILKNHCSLPFELTN